MAKPERVRSAPGLVWKQRAGGIYEARWQARTDLVKRGFPVKSVKLGSFATDPTKEEWDFIADTCNQIQQEMLVWSRGGLQAPVGFSGSLGSLMDCYMADPDSGFGKLRYNSRMHYKDLMRPLRREHGDEMLTALKARVFLRWHEKWTEGGKIAMGHSNIGMLRTLFSFGASILEDAECIRLSGVLSKMRFEMPKPRTERLTAEQAIAIRAKAHEMGRPSIALAQAFQFELMLRQGDVLGFWVPVSEPGISDTIHAGHKWTRGLRWEEIDQNNVLTHVTSKRQKKIVVSLNNSPMVLEELALLKDRPTKGPIIISEWDGLPWAAVEFRRWWRKLATAAGVPKEVRNMDSRAGAISEATDAGAELEHVRHAATHSNISMTQRYSRGAEEKTAIVQKIRNESRNKTRTK